MDDDAAFQRYDERINEIMEQRHEQAKPGAWRSNGTVARMMATMGYVPGMSLGKNPHCIIPPPNI
jgi:hypothetical protein